MLKIGYEFCAQVPHFHFGKEDGKIMAEIHLVFLEGSKYSGGLIVEDMEEDFEFIYTHEFIHHLLFEMFDRTICEKCIGCNGQKCNKYPCLVTNMLTNIDEYPRNGFGGIKIPDLPPRRWKALLGSIVKWFSRNRGQKQNEKI